MVSDIKLDGDRVVVEGSLVELKGQNHPSNVNAQADFVSFQGEQSIRFEADRLNLKASEVCLNADVLLEIRGGSINAEEANKTSVFLFAKDLYLNNPAIQPRTGNVALTHTENNQLVVNRGQAYKRVSIEGEVEINRLSLNTVSLKGDLTSHRFMEGTRLASYLSIGNGTIKVGRSRNPADEIASVQYDLLDLVEQLRSKIAQLEARLEKLERK